MMHSSTKVPGSEVRKAIRVGDRVVCVDDTCSFHRLQSGNQYVVEAAYDGSPTVIVNGAYHCLERFKLIVKVTGAK